MKAKDIAKVTRGLVQIQIFGRLMTFGYNCDCDIKLTQDKAFRVAICETTNWKEVGCPGEKWLGYIALIVLEHQRHLQIPCKLSQKHGL